MTYPQLVALQAAGDEIGGHTIDHPNLPALSPAQQRVETCGDRAALERHGLDVTDFAYPYGDYDAATLRIAPTCGYRSARIAGGLASPDGCRGPCPYAETVPPHRLFATLSADSILDTDPLSRIEGYVAGAERHGGGWVQIVFHHVCDRCDPYSVTQPTLATFLAWLAARVGHGLRVETVRQVIGAQLSPGRVRVLDRGRPLLALGADRICPGATGEATQCRARPAARVRTLRAPPGAVLTLVAPSAVDGLRLTLRAGPRSKRRRGAGPELGAPRLRVRVPATGAATVVLRASLSTGRAVYRLRLLAAPAARRAR
jgi:peptidoglycan/xylan/chitin deacetylase (PgdA/CDA1 family)